MMKKGGLLSSSPVRAQSGCDDAELELGLDREDRARVVVVAD